MIPVHKKKKKEGKGRVLVSIVLNNVGCEGELREGVKRGEEKGQCSKARRRIKKK